MFSFFNKTKLVKTSFLNVVNNTTISQLVITTLTFYNISFNNVILFITDNASYMLVAFRVLSSLIPQLKHSTCFAHILNLVGETWIEYKNFKFFDHVVSLIKTTFTYSPARKRRWISFLSANGILNPLLPPLPVKTRWNSWYNFVFWLNKHFNFFIEFYQEEEKIEIVILLF